MMGADKLLPAVAEGSGGHGHKLPLGIVRLARKRHFFPQRGSSHRGSAGRWGISLLGDYRMQVDKTTAALIYCA